MSGSESELEVINRVLPVYYDTYANLPTTNVPVQALGYATDRKVMYRWNGTVWQALSIYCGSGAAADIPTAADLPDGSLYFETDTSLVKQVQSGAWATIGGTVREIATGTYTGNDTNDRQITTGFKCTAVIVYDNQDDYFWVCLSGSSAIKCSTTPSISLVATDLVLHASDGFVVDTNNANENTVVYNYWAISE